MMTLHQHDVRQQHVTPHFQHSDALHVAKPVYEIQLLDSVDGHGEAVDVTLDDNLNKETTSR